MHQWIDPSPVDEPMPSQEKQPRAVDARPQWIEPDTMHQWVEAGPVTEDLPQGGSITGTSHAMRQIQFGLKLLF